MTVELRARGASFDGWKTVRISAGLERSVRDFELQAIDVNLPAAGAPQSPILLRPGTELEVLDDGDLIVSGHVDKIAVRASASDTSVTVSGRSKTADVNDCSADYQAKQSWRETRLETIVAELCSPFGVEVASEHDGEATEVLVDKFRLQRAETAFTAIDRLCRARGLLVTDNELGQLVLTTSGAATTSPTRLELGINVLSSNGTFDSRQLFSEYRCRGQIALPEDDAGRLMAHVSATVEDDVVGRFRPLELAPETRASRNRCRDRARYEAAVRLARAVDISVRVSGWRNGEGELWRPNTLVEYVDDVLGFSGELLISEVSWVLDDGGEIAEMRLAIPEGYELLADPLPRKRRKRRKRYKYGGGLVSLLPGPAAAAIQYAITGELPAGMVGSGAWRELDPVESDRTTDRPDSREWQNLAEKKKP